MSLKQAIVVTKTGLGLHVEAAAGGAGQDVADHVAERLSLIMIIMLIIITNNNSNSNNNNNNNNHNNYYYY